MYNEIEPIEVSIHLIQVRKHFTTFSLKAFPHVLASYQKHGIKLPIYVTPDLDNGNYDLVFGFDEFVLRKEAGEETIEVIILPLRYNESLEFVFTRNLPQIKLLGYTAVYEIAIHLEKHLQDAQWAWSFTGASGMRKVAQVLGRSKAQIEHIKAIGDYDKSLLVELDKNVEEGKQSGITKVYNEVMTKRRNNVTAKASKKAVPRLAKNQKALIAAQSCKWSFAIGKHYYHLKLNEEGMPILHNYNQKVIGEGEVHTEGKQIVYTVKHDDFSFTFRLRKVIDVKKPTEKAHHRRAAKKALKGTAIKTVLSN